MNTAYKVIVKLRDLMVSVSGDCVYNEDRLYQIGNPPGALYPYLAFDSHINAKNFTKVHMRPGSDVEIYRIGIYGKVLPMDTILERAGLYSSVQLYGDLSWIPVVHVFWTCMLSGTDLPSEIEEYTRWAPIGTIAVNSFRFIERVD